MVASGSEQTSRKHRSANRFEILSSDDDEPLVPSTVPGSSRANKDSFQLSSVSPTVPVSSSAVYRALGRAGDSSTDRIPGHPCSRPGCTFASHRKGSEIPRHVIGTPRDSESETLFVLVGSVGTVSLEGKKRSREQFHSRSMTVDLMWDQQ